MSIDGDSPITSSDGDLLGRASLATHFASSLRGLDVSDGVVVAVMGPWGSGKSSFVNLVRGELAKEPILLTLDFNPWMFSGSEQLVQFFLKELASQFTLKGERFKSISKGLNDYSDALSPLGLIPFAGPWIDRALRGAGAVHRFVERKGGGTKGLRDRLAKEMADLDAPLVVVVDDIDRLTSGEIRDIFKLVRLNASFPNLIYVLAFDRARVEKALEEDGIDGRVYLEKIVQLGYDLPSLPETALQQITFDALNSLIAEFGGSATFDDQRWPDVYVEVISPLIKSIRDVRRFALALRPTMTSLGDQIELVDLFGIEAVRVFLPDQFRALVNARTYLTSVSSPYGQSRGSDPGKVAIDALLAQAAGDVAVIEAVLERLFPATDRYTSNTFHGSGSERTWLRSHRVAHTDILSLYLENVASDGLTAFHYATGLFGALTDSDVLAKLLETVPPAQLEATIRALEVYEDDFPPEAAVSASPVLLDWISRIPERERGMLDFFRPDLVVTRVVLRLFRRLESESERAESAEKILARTRSLASQFTFLLTIGHHEGAGSKLISEADAGRLEDELKERILVAEPAILANERDLLHLLRFASEGKEVSPFDFSNPAFVATTLASAISTTRSNTMGTRAVRKEDLLAWDTLVMVMGGEDAIRSAVELVRERPELQSVVELVDKYLGGWRPTDF
jgi:hypothetical protein